MATAYPQTEVSPAQGEGQSRKRSRIPVRARREAFVLAIAAVAVIGLTVSLDVFDQLGELLPATHRNPDIDIVGSLLIISLTLLVYSRRRVRDLKRESTQRQRAETAAREGEERIRSLFEHGAAGQVVADAEGFLVQVNPFFCRMLGRDEGELVGRSFASITHPEDIETSWDSLRRLASGELDHYVIEKRYLARDGRVVPVLLSVSAVRDERGAVRFIALVQDISEQKRAEEALRSSLDQLERTNKQRGALLTNLITAQETERRRIAADIHDDSIQKLTAATMRLGMVAERHPEVGSDGSFQKAQAAVTRSIDSLRHLMFEIRPYVLDSDGLKAALRAAVKNQSELDNSLEYQVEGDFQTEPGEDARVVVFRIVQEALTNVRKHARATHVNVRIAEVDGGYTVKVQDDGAGFDASHGAHSPEGHVGLTSMRERAEMAGGWFKLDTQPDLGTAVEFWIPNSLVADQLASA